ncbi:hypothetical protein ACTXMF_07205 [Psychrobacter celer]
MMSGTINGYVMIGVRNISLYLLILFDDRYYWCKLSTDAMT